MKYFWLTNNYAYKILDPSPLKSVSEPDCSFCNATIRDIERLRQTHTRIEGGDVSLLSTAVPPNQPPTRIIVTTTITQREGREVAPDGTVEVIDGVPKTFSYAALQWAGSRWLVHDISIEKSKK